MKKSLLLGLFLAATQSISLATANDLKPAVNLLGQYGKSFPRAHLMDYVGEGKSYRAKVFGGVKLNVKYLGAVGLGLDFTATDYQLKAPAGGGSRYRRYQWDLLLVPVQIWLFTIEPGFTWNVTDARLTALGIEETSIRPGFITNLAFHLPIIKHLSLRVDGRYEQIMTDTETTSSGGKFNISGPFYSVLGGVELYL
ncbi:MAG: hypothetical protein KGQ59_07510 [Bdellovibrionales bacterium]|nr:hypothetical protein [Bdellovibrionales bacterium]